MGNKKNKNELLKPVLEELKEDPYRKFNIAFALMSIIPFLAFTYILAVKSPDAKTLQGNTAAILGILLLISLGGFCVTYQIIRNIVSTLMNYAAKAKYNDQQKSHFVTFVSHEFKGPLTVIGGNLENVTDGILGEINNEQKQVLTKCRTVTKRMTRLANDFLDLHKIEAGALKINKKQHNLIDILEKQLGEIAVALDAKRLKLIKEFSDKNLSVQVDEDRIIQVISNLLNNAIKYTPEGGTITVKAYCAEGFAKMEFIDTGEGMPFDKLETIFDRFAKLNVKEDGVGLGLAITKDIVDLHNGMILVESKMAEGSKFIVILPRDSEE